MLTPENVTIGMSARERYSMTPYAINALKERTPSGVRLLYIDSDVPAKYRPGIQDALDRFGQYDTISTDRYVLPMEAANILINSTKTSVLALIENDVIVDEKWLNPVLDILNAQEAEFVSPEIMEAHEFPLTPTTEVIYHFNPEVSEISSQDDGRVFSNIKRLPTRKAGTDPTQPRMVKHLERHAFFGLTDFFRAIAPFPDYLNTREQILMSLRIHAQSLKIKFTPESRVVYFETPFENDEIDHYLKRWDPERGQMSNDFVEREYNLIGYRSSMHAIEARIKIAHRLKERLAKV